MLVTLYSINPCPCPPGCLSLVTFAGVVYNQFHPFIHPLRATNHHPRRLPHLHLINPIRTHMPALLAYHHQIDNNSGDDGSVVV